MEVVQEFGASSADSDASEESRVHENPKPSFCEIGGDEHIPDIDQLVDSIPIPTNGGSPEVEEHLSDGFADSKPNRSVMLPPSSVLKCIRDGNQVLRSIVAQLHDLNTRIRANLKS